MNKPIFSNGITGLSDTKWMGEKGNAHKLVGVDFRSSPGIFKAQQKLKKISSNTITELCKDVVELDDGERIWFSSESGKIWRQGKLNSDDYYYILAIGLGKVYRSFDGGKTWEEETYFTRIPSILGRTSSLSEDGQYQIIGFNGGRLYQSSDYGETWTETQPAGDVDKEWNVSSVSLSGQYQTVGVNGGRLYQSSDYGETWTETQPAGDVDKHWETAEMSSSGKYQTVVCGSSDGRVYRSSDYGITWTETQPAGDVNKDWVSLSMSSSGQYQMAGVYSGRLYQSSDYGETWTETQPAGDIDTFWTLLSTNKHTTVDDGKYGLAGIQGGRLYKSSDYGVTWTETQPVGDTDSGWKSSFIKPSGKYQMVGAYGGRLYQSSDYGETWTETQPAGDIDSGWVSLSAVDLGFHFDLVHTLNPATDYEEPNSVTEIINEDKIDYTATMSISENNFDYGRVSDVVGSRLSGITEAQQISITQLDNDKFVMAYKGEDGDGFVSTFSISNYPDFKTTNTTEFEPNSADVISICAISDTHSFIANEDHSVNPKRCHVRVIDNSASVLVSTLTHDTAISGSGKYNAVCKIDNTHIALVYGGGEFDYVYLKIFSIDGAYAITEESSTLLEEVTPYDIKILEISSGRFIVAYASPNGTKAKIIDIDSSYVVTVTDTLELTTSSEKKEQISLSKIDDTHFLIAFKFLDIGKIYSVGINELDEIEVVDTFNIKKSKSIRTAIANMGDGHFFVASQDSISKTYGFVIDVDDSYMITANYDPQDIGVAYGDDKLSIIFDGDNRNGRGLFLFGSTKGMGVGELPIISLIKINETFSSGIVLNPAGTDAIELMQSKIQSLKYSEYQYLREKIDVKDADDLTMLVVVGSTTENSHITSVTTNEETLTLVDEQETPAGFTCNLSYYIKTGIDTGENVVKVNYSEDTVYNAFVAILIFKNVNQTTPTLATKDSGWKNYLTLPTTTQHSLRIGSFLTRKNTHTHGAYENILAELEIAEDSELFSLSISSRGYNIGTSKILGASEFSYTEPEIVASDKYDYRPEQTLNKIYYCNENILFAVPVDKIDSWSDNIEVIGSFKNGDDKYHPMVNQNLELYIGDDNVMAKVDVNGVFNQETLFNIKSPDKIQTISTFDTDLLVGVVGVNKSKILRWDTFSQSWSAEDEVFETGINAFIKDDNYTYVSAGDYGRIYFYNGEKLELYKRIPGDFSSTKKAIINSNSVGFINGHTIFGLSNSSNNPTEQGVYCLGSYDSRYPKSLSLDYPVPTNELNGVSLGAIIVNGSDMYVSYKTLTDVGIAKIDHSNKYNGAYLETMQLTSLVERDDDSIVERIVADYVSMPDNTSVAISTKTKYDTDYTEQTLLVDTDKMSVRTKNSIPKISSLQVKLELTTSGNDSPEIENLGII